MVTVKLTEKYKNIDIKTNIIILRNQLMQGQWNYGNLLTYDRIKDSYINIYIGNCMFENYNDYQLINDDDKLTEIKLMDIFEQVKFKSIPSNYEPNNKDMLIYPLIGAKKVNNGIVKFIDIYNIDTKGKDYLTLCKQGDGGAGYCFVHNGKFSLCSTMYLLKLKEEYENKIDLKINEKLLTIQITNMGFCFSRSINNERLNEIKVYLKFNK